MFFRRYYLVSLPLFVVFAASFLLGCDSSSQDTSANSAMLNQTLFSSSKDAGNTDASGPSFHSKDTHSDDAALVTTEDVSADSSNPVPLSVPMPSSCLEYPETANGPAVVLSKCTHAGLPMLFQGIVVFGNGEPVKNTLFKLKFKFGVFGWFSKGVDSDAFNFSANGSHTVQVTTDKDGYYQVSFSMSHPTWIGPKGDVWYSVCPGQLNSLEVEAEAESNSFQCQQFCDGLVTYNELGGTPGYEVPLSVVQDLEYKNRDCVTQCSAKKALWQSAVQYPLLKSDGQCFQKPSQYPFGIFKSNLYVIKQVGLPADLPNEPTQTK